MGNKAADPKRCITCGVPKARAEFYGTKKSKNSVQSSCKACARLSAAQRSCNEVQKKSRLKQVWGMSLAEFDALLEAQGGGCAICGTSAPGGTGRFPIDHCHTTGRIRGLLCTQCNLGLGGLKDDPALLRRAIAYLESGVDLGFKS